ncbi:YcnI family copper-binding membrane protein [Luteipulveratus halotolerans]|uniref:YncI copper-binding domain-containing protein n=1 Tax=Luteipulveratus halotolerans TaxID=1631356 RepID=A0A0L6CNE3_9MICO|nr:YcnI family protein [Luteipulveratus halotolerans]KNX39038.1 hypothetical protein VV01_20940 [Luteipulveratus halotolerans]
MRSTLPRLLTVGALAGLTLAGTAASASAHVRVTPSTTAAGSYSQLTFRVPNERDDASTTKVTVTLPQADPFLSVSVKPVPGWAISTATAKLPKPVDDEGTTITEAVRTVTWTASGANAIRPEQYQEFAISVGKLPAAGKTVVLPADQTYSNGEVVRWNQPTEAGAAEPDKPAPALTVTAAEGGHGAAPAAAPSAAPAAAAAPESGGTASTDSTARWLGGGGLLAGVVGIGAGVLGWTRPRKDGQV